MSFVNAISPSQLSFTFKAHVYAYELAADPNALVKPSQAPAAASIGSDPGPAYIRPELISGDRRSKSIAKTDFYLS
jgi:hypothetical protein